ncbi:MAG TPA: hypothetical protein VLA19_01795 [Herpetosiphonaceae bacterium]|nr:hypothetical protein [Herpetosiphonaceae bacterium]
MKWAIARALHRRRTYGHRHGPHGHLLSHTERMAVLRPPGLLPRYTEARRAAVMMEQEIAAPGLGEQYAITLARRIGYDKTPAGALGLITATPRERCDAALAVIERIG